MVAAFSGILRYHIWMSVLKLMPQGHGVVQQYWMPIGCSGNGLKMARHWNHGKGVSIPIILTCVVWGPSLAKLHVNFCCDNASLVITINKNSSKDKLVMHLLRTLSFFVAYFDLHLTVSHLPGVINVTADHLSQGNQHQAFQACPSLASQPTTISPDRLDWTSPQFPQLP